MEVLLRTVPSTELEQRGYFIHSPSDEVPDDDGEDKTYRPPKCSNSLDDDETPGVYLWQRW